MKLLVIVAHGSRLQSSNEEIINLVNTIKSSAPSGLFIKYAFLELAEPSITDCITESINEENLSEIDVFPYFLAAGKHVKNDIPEEINLLQKKYENIKINLLPHLGKNEGLINLILSTQTK